MTHQEAEALGKKILAQGSRVTNVEFVKAKAKGSPDTHGVKYKDAVSGRTSEVFSRDDWERLVRTLGY